MRTTALPRSGPTAQSRADLAAAALIVTLPMLIITVFVQRQIVVGITAGAVKG